MIANVATLNKIELNSVKGPIERYFTLDSLKQLCESAVGKPVTLGFNGISMGKIEKAWVDGEKAFVEFSTDVTLNYLPKYLVPGLKITTTERLKFKTVRCIDFALTDKPVDKTLLTIHELNNADSYYGQGSGDMP